jgi:hypothetical protein
VKRVLSTAVLSPAIIATVTLVAVSTMFAGRANASAVPAAPSNLEWGSPAVGVPPQLSWKDNSNNEDGFRLYHLISGSERLAVAEYPANQTGAATPEFTFEQWCDGIELILVAFNEAGESTDSDVEELPPPPSGCSDSFVIVIFNDSGISAGRMLMEVAGVDDARVVGNAPGCPSPDVSLSGSGGPGQVLVSWLEGCVDPLDGLSLRLRLIGPAFIGAPRWIPELRNGDVNCTGTADAIDALAILRDSAGLAYPRQAACPGFDEIVPLADANCDGDNNVLDALAVLQSVGGAYVPQNEPCPEVGQLV